MRPTTIPILAALAVAVLGSAAAAQTRLTTTRVATGFNAPLYATPRPGDADSLFVVEQSTGLIRIVRGGAILPTPFANLRSRLSVGGERGLLGLAFHPDYRQNGFFYVNYTRSGDGATVVERFGTSANPDLADLATGTVMLGPIPQPYSNHNGGCLQFGPDGYLYVSTGDGGSGGDPGCLAQNGQSLLGKILRLDVDSPTTRIPANNPFVGDPAFRDEIWSYGLRNPWRFSFDRLTGDMWIGDVGQNAIEEIDFQPAASRGGENYGWKVMEGRNCFSTAACATNVPRCNDPSLVLPIQQYTHSFGCSITGGYVYRGCDVPDLRGAYFYADYCSNRIWTIRYDGSQVTEFIERTAELRPTSGTINSITSFGEDARGELLIVARDGNIWRIEASGPAPSRDLGFGTAGANGRIPAFEVCGRLSAGAVGELRLGDAAPGAPAAILIGGQNNPTPILPFGTVVPYPIDGSVAATTDADGVATFPLQGGGPNTIYYAQWVVLDPGGPGGVALSNAREVIFP
jgi:glucose/arabinose dehydrogenase